jgi:hypothetical protein
VEAPFLNKIGMAFRDAKDFIDRLFFVFDALVVGRNGQGVRRSMTRFIAKLP